MTVGMDASQILYGAKAASREELLARLSEKAVELGFADDARAVYEAFLEREALGATGFVSGFAIPHVKSSVVKRPGVIAVTLAEPLSWPSYDHSDAGTVIALLIPEIEVGETHLNLLSRTVAMIMDERIRELLDAAADAGQLASVIDEGLGR